MASIYEDFLFKCGWVYGEKGPIRLYSRADTRAEKFLSPSHAKHYLVEPMLLPKYKYKNLSLNIGFVLKDWVIQNPWAALVLKISTEDERRRCWAINRTGYEAINRSMYLGVEVELILRLQKHPLNFTGNEIYVVFEDKAVKTFSINPVPDIALEILDASCLDEHITRFKKTVPAIVQPTSVGHGIYILEEAVHRFKENKVMVNNKLLCSITEKEIEELAEQFSRGTPFLFNFYDMSTKNFAINPISVEDTYEPD